MKFLLMSIVIAGSFLQPTMAMEDDLFDEILGDMIEAETYDDNCNYVVIEDDIACIDKKSYLLYPYSLMEELKNAG